MESGSQKALAKYDRECELYVLARKDWEFQAVIQAWEKPGISWPIEIQSFNYLLDLASSEQKSSPEFSTLVEKEDRSCLGTETYIDKIEDEISSESEEPTRNSWKFESWAKYETSSSSKFESWANEFES